MCQVRVDEIIIQRLSPSSVRLVLVADGGVNLISNVTVFDFGPGNDSMNLTQCKDWALVIGDRNQSLPYPIAESISITQEAMHLYGGLNQVDVKLIWKKMFRDEREWERRVDTDYKDLGWTIPTTPHIEVGISLSA